MARKACLTHFMYLTMLFGHFLAKRYGMTGAIEPTRKKKTRGLDWN